MLIQFLTSMTGLQYFLNKVQVPGYESGEYSYGKGLETPRHVLLQYPYETERREALKERQEEQLDFTRLLDAPRGAPIASKQILGTLKIKHVQR
jgi:hypothetical protein